MGDSQSKPAPQKGAQVSPVEEGHAKPENVYPQIEQEKVKTLPLNQSENLLPPAPSTSEVEFLQERGLGTGINCTDPRMWGNRSQLRQVRKVTPDLSNISKFEYSGSLEYCTESIATVHTNQDQISVGIQDPHSKVKISVHAENTQKTETIMKGVFLKVHTRSIAFSVSTPPPTIFRDDFCTSIGESCNINPGLEVEIEKYMKESPEKAENVADACRKYIEKERITHYVYCIDLGAVQFGAYTNEEYQEKYGGGVNFEVGGNEIAFQSKFENMLHQSTTREKCIGRFTGDYQVKRGTSDEAVITFTIRPIYSLLDCPLLQRALCEAVECFVRCNKVSENPRPSYYIYCNRGEKPIYWTVNDQNEIIGTAEPKSSFCIESTPSRDVHKFEFHIVHYKFNSSRRFLACDVDVFGNHCGPLKVDKNPLYKHTHFVLHRPLRRGVMSWGNLRFPCTTMPCTYKPEEVQKWIDGDDFLINCSRRRFKIDGYLAMEECEGDTDNKNDSFAAQNYNYYKLAAYGTPTDDEKKFCEFTFYLRKASKSI